MFPITWQTQYENVSLLKVTGADISAMLFRTISRTVGSLAGVSYLNIPFVMYIINLFYFFIFL